MDVKSHAKRFIRNIWDENEEEVEDFAAPSAGARTAGHDHYGDQDAAQGSATSQGNNLLNGSRRLRSLSQHPRAHEKNIYTLRPKNLDEAAIAADYLKSGSAVVINHEMVDRATSSRIIDFMSGVCYGLENQGHAMKLGETIFLFTPGEFEINSDEVDYGENRDHFFKTENRSNVSAAVAASQVSQPQQTSAPSPTAGTSPQYSRSVAPTGQVTSYMGAPHVERRSWER